MNTHGSGRLRSGSMGETMIDMTPEAIHFLVRGVLVSAPHGRCNLTHDQTIAVCNEVERLAARKCKDFQAADRIRDELVAAGIVLLDGPEGTRWRRTAG